MRLAQEFLEDHRQWQPTPSLSFELENVSRAASAMVEGLAELRSGDHQRRGESLEDGYKKCFQRMRLLREFYEELDERNAVLDLDTLFGELEKVHRQGWFTLLLRSKEAAVRERVRSVLIETDSLIGQRPKLNESHFKKLFAQIRKQHEQNEGRIDRKLLQQYDQFTQELMNERHFGGLVKCLKTRVPELLSKLLLCFEGVHTFFDDVLSGCAQSSRIPTYETEMRDTVAEAIGMPSQNHFGSRRVDNPSIGTPMKLLKSPSPCKPERTLKPTNFFRH